MNRELKNNENGTKNISKKMKAMFFATMAICVLILVVTVTFMFKTLNPPAVMGEMSIKSSGKTIAPYTNVLQEKEGKNETTYKPLNIEDIAAEVPFIDYDGDITVNYSEYTLEDFRFTMWDEDLNMMYEDYGFYDHPDEGGTYYVRIQFSWGRNEKNTILTENYFKVNYTDKSLSTEHNH